jgi:mevalonate kinase
MIIAEKRDFFAKILLFGEYIIIDGGQALVIPLRKFSGCFSFFSENSNHRDAATVSHDSIRSYFNYLLELDELKKFSFPLDLQSLETDLSKGLYFKSNIPQGYGVGSSGALVAALFYHYSLSGYEVGFRKPSIDLEELRKQLALMESWFHGNSSGLDPLSSLLARPFLTDGSKKIRFQKVSVNTNDSRPSIFLVDTGAIGKTRPLVDWFRKEKSKKRLNSDLLNDLSNETLKAFLDKDDWLFWNYLAQLSMFQLENMKPMIPETIRKLWDEGLYSKQYNLKLCGSGGGGFVLGFCKDYSFVKEMFDKSGLRSFLV